MVSKDWRRVGRSSDGRLKPIAGSECAHVESADKQAVSGGWSGWIAPERLSKCLIVTLLLAGGISIHHIVQMVEMLSPAPASSRGQPLSPRGNHCYPLYRMGLSSDCGQVAVCGRCRDGGLFDVGSGRLMTRLCRPGHRVTALALSPCGKVVLTGYRDGSLVFWNSREKAVVRQGHNGGIRICTFSPSGRWAVTGGYDRILRVWKTSTHCCITEIPIRDGTVEFLRFSPDGTSLLALHSPHTIGMWDICTGRELRRFDGLPRRPKTAAFSPSGHRAIAATFRGIVCLWDVATAEELQQWQAPTRAVASLAWSPDGQRIALAGESSGRILLCDPVQGHHLQTLFGHEDPVRALDFSPDGRRLFSAGYDGTFRVWNVSGGREVRRHKLGSALVAFAGADSRSGPILRPE